VAWLLLTFYVPLLLVSHVIVFWLLLRAAPSAQAERERSFLEQGGGLATLSSAVTDTSSSNAQIKSSQSN